MKKTDPDMFVSKVIGKTIEFDEPARSVTSVITREVVDSDGEVVLCDGLNMERFDKNPVVLWMHNPHDVIGKCEWMKPQTKGGIKQIIAKTKFAETPLANEIFTLAIGGYLKGTSIGMAWPSIIRRDITPSDLKDNPHWGGARNVVLSAQLMEFSHVSIPANPEALSMAHSKGLISARTFGYFVDYLQPSPAVVRVSDDQRRPTVKRVADADPPTIERVPVTIKRIREPLNANDMRQIVAMSEGRL